MTGHDRDLRQASSADEGFGGSLDSATGRYHVIHDYWRTSGDIAHDAAHFYLGAAEPGLVNDGNWSVQELAVTFSEFDSSQVRSDDHAVRRDQLFGGIGQHGDRT